MGLCVFVGVKFVSLSIAIHPYREGKVLRNFNGPVDRERLSNMSCIGLAWVLIHCNNTGIIRINTVTIND
jgi:hypothetical protein